MDINARNSNKDAELKMECISKLTVISAAFILNIQNWYQINDETYLFISYFLYIYEDISKKRKYL